MQLIVDSLTLSQTLTQFIEQHKNIAIAVAWASANTMVFETLQARQNKIRYTVIGTHFYQTHPDVIDNFIDCNEVRFVLQPQGIFHPKAYLFWTGENWDILIGSANLTAGALGNNSELMIHISSADADADIKLQLKNQIREYWNQGEVVTAESAVEYRNSWQLQQPLLRRISGVDLNGNEDIPRILIDEMSWQSFFQAVQADPFLGFSERCDLLDLAREAFQEHATYSEMVLGLRKTIAGLPNDFNNHWGWFGSMRGAGYYHQAVNNNNPHLSAALDFIPLDGAVTRQHYDSYIAEFIMAFPNGRHGVATASRLLALKRPDYFVCLDSRNRQQLCENFGIRLANMTYERYWEDIICRIFNSVWWNEPRPANGTALRVWLGRAAMLDAVFYRP